MNYRETFNSGWTNFWCLNGYRYHVLQHHNWNTKKGSTEMMFFIIGSTWSSICTENLMGVSLLLRDFLPVSKACLFRPVLEMKLARSVYTFPCLLKKDFCCCFLNCAPEQLRFQVSFDLQGSKPRSNSTLLIITGADLPSIYFADFILMCQNRNVLHNAFFPTSYPCGSVVHYTQHTTADFPM